ncbi:MAG: hypothetical protein QOE11_2776 [Solirubrobacteraceae bacterium]|nr:hypothetical protein [Solirubrobacteraceae bacterium]
MSRLPALEASIAAYDAWEPQLHAFAWFDRERVRARAAAQPARGRALAGIPVAVKDIFDTAGIPTQFGSPIFAGRVPARSAVSVSRLEAAGALMFGKTVTAELAYYQPGPTTNPWDPARTPGGSSMGSAAAVAAGIVPLAIGSQTNGSVVRPAAFCGVVGFKPSAGRLPTAGALSFSPTLDQLGVFARSVAGAARLAAVLADEAAPAWLAPSAKNRPRTLGVVRTPEWEEASSPMRAGFHAALVAIESAGCSLRELTMSAELADAIATHRTIMAVEAQRVLAPLVAGELDRCGTQIRDLFAAGAATAPAAYQAALDARLRLGSEFDRWTADLDAVVTLAVLGEAPPIATTGDPRCCTRWTLLGAPAFSLPNGMGPDGLPLAIQLVGRRGADRELVGIAEWVEELLAPAGTPPVPGAR